MKVWELIGQLRGYDDNADVFISDETTGGLIEITDVSDQLKVGINPSDDTYCVILMTDDYNGT